MTSKDGIYIVQVKYNSCCFYAIGVSVNCMGVVYITMLSLFGHKTSMLYRKFPMHLCLTHKNKIITILTQIQLVHDPIQCYHERKIRDMHASLKMWVFGCVCIFFILNQTLGELSRKIKIQ